MRVAIAVIGEPARVSGHAGQARIREGVALPGPRFDPTTVLCRVRDLFSRH